MKRTGTLLLSLGLLPMAITPFLNSCTTEKNPPKPTPDEFKVSIDDKNRLGFSYNKAPIDHYADYQINFEGTIQNDDYLEISISSQQIEGETGQYIELLSNSIWININPETKSFTIQVQKTPYFEDTVFTVTFSIEICVWRDRNIIDKLSLENLYFCNATPTIDSMFLTHENEDGKIVLDGLSNEPWVTEQIKLCNMFLVPKNISIIAENAFYNEEKEVSLMPKNMEILMLNSNLGFSTKDEILESVGKKAFFKSNFVTIWLPKSLVNLETEAFGGNARISQIYLHEYEKVPSLEQWSGHQIFYDENMRLDGKIYIHSNSLEFEWNSLMAHNEGSTSPILGWTYISL